MAKLFNVNLPDGMSSIKLDSQGRATVQYTVKYVSQRSLDGRAVLISLPQTRPASGVVEKGWVKVDGKTDRHFNINSEETFTVNIAVPPKSPAGTYTFRLDTVWVDQTDQGDAGGAVAFTVSAPSPEGKSKWPLILIVVAVVLIIGGFTTWLLTRKPTVAVQPQPVQPLPAPSPSPAPVSVGTIIGVGTDNMLYTRTALTGPWTMVPGSGSVKAVMRTLDGLIVGVGTDNQLYVRPNLTTAWTLVPGSGLVSAVTQMRDGTIVGIGMDSQLWVRPSLYASWNLIPGSGLVIGVIQRPDGTLLGVGTDRQLYTRATLYNPWVLVPGSGSVLAVAQLSNGNLLGVGTDNLLYTRATLNSPWVQAPNTGLVISVTTMP